jgi:K+-transporting ATPase ATPase C chain
LFLLLSLVLIVCAIYPAILLLIGQIAFPFQANGSILYDKDHKPIGSKLIAQQFSQDRFFQPRPSAANYDASASSSSALAASNYALRDRIARSIGPIAKYITGQAVGPDIEKWFAADQFQQQSNIVAQWAKLHPELAQAWVATDEVHTSYVNAWIKNQPVSLSANTSASGAAVSFFEQFSKQNPGKFLSLTDGKIALINSGTDIQALFFDMWRQDHPDAELQDLPGDYVTTSGSGLDPHISLQNAKYQLDRIATAWANITHKDSNAIHNSIEQLLDQHAQAPLGGLAGQPFVNVLELNLALQQQFGNN